MKGGLVDIDSLSGLLRGAAVSSSSSVEAERLPPPMAPPAISTEPEEAPASADDEGGEVEAPARAAEPELRRFLTPEYDSFATFAERCQWRFDEASCASYLLPTARPIERRSGLRMEDVTEQYLGLGNAPSKPLVVTDSQLRWSAMADKWSPRFFAENFGATDVIANDRAPARLKDRQTNRPQRSVQMPLRDYVNYMEDYDDRGMKESDVPLYLNGWHAFKAHPELLEDIQWPQSQYFVEDHTRMILKEIDTAISGKKGTPTNPQWVHNTDVLLNKVFMGPVGNITRLHFDAHHAHGWLAQVKGSKLFILYPPSDTDLLQPLEGEATTQSPIDPLAPDLEKFPNYEKCHQYYAVLREGETLLCPDGWWHYAVSLDESITVMRNFYNALTNVNGLVKLFANLRKKAAA